MWAFLRHPLTIALIGVAITGGLVPYVTRLWQERQKALDTRVSLMTDMSDSSMSLMARVEVAHKFTHMLDDSSSSERRRRGKLREQRDRAWHSLNEEWQRFEVREAVIGTKLQAYLPKPELNIAKRWCRLGGVLTELAHFEGWDVHHKDEYRERIFQQLEELDGICVDPQSWNEFTDWNALTNRITDERDKLIKDVRDERRMEGFRTSWIRWR
jgi:hypothetical protein